MLRVYFSLGSNLGDRLGYLKLGLSELESRLGSRVFSSSVYETEPVDFVDQPHFLNLVCYLDTESSVTDILDFCKQIEFEAKRQPIKKEGGFAVGDTGRHAVGHVQERGGGAHVVGQVRQRGGHGSGGVPGGEVDQIRAAPVGDGKGDPELGEVRKEVPSGRANLQCDGRGPSPWRGSRPRG